MCDWREEILKVLGDRIVTGADAQSFALDEMEPVAVLRPHSPEEMQHVMRILHQHRVPGVVWGGGTQIETGSPPQAYLWAMETRSLQKLIDYSADDLVMTVQAGMTLSQLQEILRKHHQWLPIDSPIPDRQTIGGIVSSQSAGPKRQRYGLPREWLLAVKVVLSTGELVRGGAPVVKSVAGYDMPRLFAGSWGTLGILTELTFKVAALPEQSRLLSTRLNGSSDLAVAWEALSHPLMQTEILELRRYSTAGGEWWLYVGLAGFHEDVEWLQGLLCERMPSEWFTAKEEDYMRLRDECYLSSASVRCRCVVPPAQGVELVGWCAQRFPESEVQAHFGLGVIRLWWEGEPPSVGGLLQLRAEAQRLGGFCILERAPREVKMSIPVWDHPGGGVKVMQRLKSGLDPHGILAPGRFVGEM